MSTLSVVIVSYNSLEVLTSCLESVLEAIRYCHIKAEIVVVDNNSEDGTIDYIRKAHPLIKIIELTDNRGFAYGNNVGMEVTNGDFLLFLNPDTIVFPDAIINLIEFSQSVPLCGIAGPQLINRDGSIQPSGARLPSLINSSVKVLFDATGLSKVRLFSDFYHRHFVWGRKSFDDSKTVGEVSGAAMLVKRQVIESVGFFDPGFFLYFEDVDLCKRAWNNHWQVWYVPAAKITHLWGSPQMPKIQTAIKHLESERFYFNKHHGQWACFILRILHILNESLILVKLAIKRFSGGRKGQDEILYHRTLLSYFLTEERGNQCIS